MCLTTRALLRAAFLGLVLLLVLAACAQGKPHADPPPTAAAPDATAAAATAAALPDKTTALLIKPEDGGRLALRDGAELALPRQSLSDASMVTLRVVEELPPAPVPFSLIGRAYDIALETGSLVGVGVLTLPLPAGMTTDQFDLGAYTWNGRAWERVEGRPAEGGIRVGVEAPGTYAVLGTWRMADADLTVSLPPIAAGQPTFPVETRGQYRYRVLPAMQHDYVEARLALKRDNSGGAGQVSGNDTLDPTVADTVVWFKPDPSQPEGAIDFNYTFQVDPVALGVALGSVNQFYVALSVADSPAPTRRLSNAAQYVAQLPIKVDGTDVVRPDVPNSSQALQWHVQLNGQTLLRRPATGLTLSLAEILAQGGLGEYRISLEAEYQGQLIPVSNEVTVQLALPGTVTPTPSVSPTVTPWPFGTMPPTPTRRARPNGTPGALDYPAPGVPETLTPTPTVTPTLEVTPTPTRPTGSIFWSDREVVNAGECTTLHWNVENIAAVYFENNPTTGNNSQQVCPAQSQTYSLRTIDQAGNSQNYRVTITVQGAGQAQPGDITFSVDQYQITPGNCATLTWRAVNVRQVFLDGNGVAGEASQPVCPKYTTNYTLTVIDLDDKTTTRTQTVWVLPAGGIALAFWADQYTLNAGSCTTLHWIVDNVQNVYLRVAGSETGVAGHSQQQVCPKGSETYALRATASDNRTASKELRVQVGPPGLGPGEVIAQGVITSVTESQDLDPTTVGNMAGWQVVVDGVAPIAKGSGSCCGSKITLLINKSLMTGQYPLQVDWPVHPGQLVEFWLSPCNADKCEVFNVPQQQRFYLKVRSN